MVKLRVEDADEAPSEIEQSEWRLFNMLPCLVYGSCIIFQIVLTYFNFNSLGNKLLVLIGQMLWLLSFVLGWLPIYTFKRHGEVPKGDSYINTTVLVDTGLYAIVRHPQFLAWIIVSLSLALMSQHWLNALLFIPVLVGTVYDTKKADMRLIQKFGPQYETYKEKVPALNIIAGTIRYFQRKN
jgi:protein-S-isoprenylcysteine O-methyltransferase Ste14